MTAIGECEPTEVVGRVADIMRLADEFCPELGIRVQDIIPDFRINFTLASELLIRKYEPVHVVKHEILNVIYKQIGMLTTIAESMRAKL